MQTRLLYIFTRTPLHVGAGASIGAIDQPIQRERHTGFPVIPASSLKGSFADQWPTKLKDDSGGVVRVKTKKVDDKIVASDVSDAAWLFGSDDAKEGLAAAGALLFGEARLLAFPVRSARGSFAWITSPLLLRRAARDGVFDSVVAAGIEKIHEDGDATARFALGKIDLSQPNQPSRLVLEGYTFTRPEKDGDLPAGLGAAFAQLINRAEKPTGGPPASARPIDPVWAEVATRLVVLSDGQMSYFATTACEVVQHVRISDVTGTAETGGLFNQENVPSETLFYAPLRSTNSRLKGKAYVGSPLQSKTEADAIDVFEKAIVATGALQFGADASTGLGYCTVQVAKPAWAIQPSEEFNQQNSSTQR